MNHASRQLSSRGRRAVLHAWLLIDSQARNVLPSPAWLSTATALPHHDDDQNRVGDEEHRLLWVFGLGRRPATAVRAPCSGRSLTAPDVASTSAVWYNLIGRARTAFSSSVYLSTFDIRLM